MSVVYSEHGTHTFVHLPLSLTVTRSSSPLTVTLHHPSSPLIFHAVGWGGRSTQSVCFQYLLEYACTHDPRRRSNGALPVPPPVEKVQAAWVGMGVGGMGMGIYVRWNVVSIL